MTIEKLAKDAKDIRERLLISKRRKTIEKLFESTTPTEEDITIRLIVIDSLFSTHSIRIRHNNLYEVAEEIHAKTGGNDKIFCEYIEKYLNDGKDGENLFDRKYGNKYGNKEAGELSLISKYCFFVTNNQFPIIDDFTRRFAKKIETNKKENIIFQIKTIKEENKISYDDFDAIAWIYGKITKEITNKKEENRQLFGEDGNNIFEDVRDFKDIVDEFIDCRVK